MSYLTPLQAREAAVAQALADHAARRAASKHLAPAERREARRASILTYECEVDAAHAVYGAAVAAMTRRLILCDRAAYEVRHGTLDAGLTAFRAEDVETARAELMAQVA